MKKFHIWNSFEGKDYEINRYQPLNIFFLASCSCVQDQDFTKHTLTGQEIVETPAPRAPVVLVKMDETVSATMEASPGSL